MQRPRPHPRSRKNDPTTTGAARDDCSGEAGAISLTEQLVLGARGSPLARWQARHVADLLRDLHPAFSIEQRVISTAGDVQAGRPLGPGDLGVRDTLPSGSGAGPGSPRRRPQLLEARPDGEVVAIRGNVETRVRMLIDSKLDALVLALAGVERLGVDAVEVRVIPTATCVPAVGQGALAIQTRVDDSGARALVSGLDHRRSHTEVAAERAFFKRLGGGCLGQSLPRQSIA